MFHFGAVYDTIRAIFMKQLTQRQLKIMNFVEERKRVSNREIVDLLKDIARITVVRDLNFLLREGFILKRGKGRSVYYEPRTKNPALKYIDADIYFQKGPDERTIVFERFNFDIFDMFRDILSEEETKELEELNLKYRKRVASLPAAALKKELERLTVEFSWKSSRIEGNTYSLLETEILIKERKEAEGHKKEEAIMILNHKEALDYILNNRKDFRNLTLAKINNLHQLIVKDLGVPQGIRKNAAGIIGTKYKPLDYEYQIREAIEKLVTAVNRMENIFIKTIFATLMISYIQPFVDGNKRTARILGNAILLAYNFCPLSLRSVDEVEYRKAVILFYEQNSIRFFKDLFVEQFRFSAQNYFLY